PFCPESGSGSRPPRRRTDRRGGEFQGDNRHRQKHPAPAASPPPGPLLQSHETAFHPEPPGTSLACRLRELDQGNAPARRDPEKRLAPPCWLEREQPPDEPLPCTACNGRHRAQYTAPARWFAAEQKRCQDPFLASPKTSPHRAKLAAKNGS